MTSNPDPVVIRELERLDYARAARASLAQVERDAGALDAVLTDLSERWPARVAPTHLDEAG